MLTELPICILTGERPIDGSLCDVAGLLPGVNLALQAVSAFNSPVQPLTTERSNRPARAANRSEETRGVSRLNMARWNAALAKTDMAMVHIARD
jgi:hypothetical protein